jgi:outer membrane protein assembly factor BamB
MGRWKIWAALGAAVVGLSGCWPAPGAGPNRQSFNGVEQGITVDNVDTFTAKWTATTADSSRGVGPPIVSDRGLLHVATDHVLYGFDPRTGALRWANDTGTERFFDPELHQVTGHGLLAAVALTDDPVYFQNLSVDPATGAAQEVGFTNAGRVDSARGPLIVTSQPISCCGYDELALGEPGQPELRTGVVALVPDAFSSRMTLGTDRVYQAGLGATNTHASPDGNQGPGVRAFPFAGASDCGDQHFQTLICPEWVAPMDSEPATSPVLSSDESTLYTVSDVGTVYAVDTATGAVEWSVAVGAGVLQTPALAYGTLFVPTVTGELVAVDAATGAVEWSTAGTSELTVQPAVAGGVVFTGALDGTVAAYDAHGCGAVTCAELWSDNAGSRITGAPAISLGKVFVGTQDGRVIAYGPSGV